MDDDKTQRIYVTLDEKAKRRMHELLGASRVSAALDEAGKLDRLPAGFGYAKAIVDKVLAELRMEHSQSVLRLASAQGIGLLDHNLLSEWEPGKGMVVFAQPMDLAERAEA